MPATVRPKILDVGCGQGEDLDFLKQALPRDCELHGIEGYAPYRDDCAAKGITAVGLDIERDALPYADVSFDVVLINQVLEHTKDLFFICSEVSRILKPGGLFLVGVPNLAAWHDRLLLALGEQPSGMKVLGPHVRGFTLPGFRKFAECDGYFKLEARKGSGFFPFPVGISKALASIFPTLATAIFFRLRRTEKPGVFMDVLRSRRFETNYYQGPA
jgi:SAM-dependent methyltransferase